MKGVDNELQIQNIKIIYTIYVSFGIASFSLCYG